MKIGTSGEGPALRRHRPPSSSVWSLAGQFGGGGMLGALIAAPPPSPTGALQGVLWGALVGLVVGAATYLLFGRKTKVKTAPAAWSLSEVRRWTWNDLVWLPIGFAAFVAMGYCYVRFFDFTFGWFLCFVTSVVTDQGLTELRVRHIERTQGCTVVEDRDGDLVALPHRIVEPGGHTSLADP
jgi:hypothetical protein